MTRRLDPYDRVRELGDASVPFIFDTHAIIYAEDAPSLENALHKRFSDRRLNLVNNRKEFFRATLDEIEKCVREVAPNADFIRKVEARDYRESRAIRERNEAPNIETDVRARFPESI